MPSTSKERFTTRDIPESPMDRKIEEEEEEEKEEDPSIESSDPTIIPVSKTRLEYEKAKIPYPPNPTYDRRESHHRLTSGNWKRKITKIAWIRTIDNEEFLDWNEIRIGKTSMQRTVEETVDHVTQYEVPIPAERVEFNAEQEEYRTVIAERPRSIETFYSVPYSKSVLDRLLKDTINRTTEYTIQEQHGRTYHISKKELQTANGNFEKLYNKKAGIKEEEKGEKEKHAV